MRLILLFIFLSLSIIFEKTCGFIRTSSSPSNEQFIRWKHRKPEFPNPINDYRESDLLANIEDLQSAETQETVANQLANILTDDDIKILKHKEKLLYTDRIHFTNGVEDFEEVLEPEPESTQWPDAVIPFVIESVDKKTFNDGFYSAFSDAIEDFHQMTCVRFRPKCDSDRFFIRIFSGDG